MDTRPEERTSRMKKATSLHLTTEGQHSSPCWGAGGLLLFPCRWHGPPRGQRRGGAVLWALLNPGSKGWVQKGSDHHPLLPSSGASDGQTPPAQGLGRGEGLKWPLGPLPGLGILAGAERHYGRHSLGLVLFIVSTGLNVSGQLYLHVAEKGHHLQLLQRKQTQLVRHGGRARHCLPLGEPGLHVCLQADP